MQRVAADGTKSLGLHVSKTDIIYARSLGQLLRDPRIVAAFYLAHPVNKLSSFAHKMSTGPAPETGYLSHWEYDEEPNMSINEVSPDVLLSANLSPPSEDLEVGPPQPRGPRDPITK